MIFQERALARQIRAGNPEGFDTLYARYADRVMGFALRLSGSHADAEDLTQEVFLAAYAGHASFQGRSKLLTWLLGITMRRWRDRTRRHQLEMVIVPDSEDRFAGCVKQDTLEKSVIETLTLTTALLQLDPPFREALLLVASQGLTYREAADILGEPIGTVKWRVFEASRRMQRLLENVEEEFDGMQQAEPSADRFHGIG